MRREQTGSATRNTQAAAEKNITINYAKISSTYQIINGQLVSLVREEVPLFIFTEQEILIITLFLGLSNWLLILLVSIRILPILLNFENEDSELA